MKIWKYIGLGVALWSFTLIWPDINRVISEPVLLKLLLGLTGVVLAYLIERHFRQDHNQDENQRPNHTNTEQHHKYHNSRPVSATPTH